LKPWGSDDLLETVLLPALNRRALLQLAKELEEGSEQQCRAVTAEIGHLPQLARVLGKLGEGNSDHKSRLESLSRE